MQNLFKRYHKKLGYTQEQAQEMWFAYVPKDIYLWRYIDQVYSSTSPTESAQDRKEEDDDEDEDSDDSGETPWPPPMMGRL